MTRDEDRTHNPRREFLRQTAAAGAGAVAVAALPGIAAASEHEIAPAPSAKQGYRLTGHIVEYYKSAAE